MYEFHARYGIKPQRGHGRHDANGAIRWCFADPEIAKNFAGEFGSAASWCLLATQRTHQPAGPAAAAFGSVSQAIRKPASVFNRLVLTPAKGAPLISNVENPKAA